MDSGTDGVSHEPTPTATRTSSSSNAMATVCGSTTIGRGLTMSGIRTTSSCSVSETAFFSATSDVVVFLFGIRDIFFQPPNIFPTSSSFSATSSHCLLEMSFPSHATETRNLRVSNTRRHFVTFSIFFSFSVK